MSEPFKIKEKQYFVIDSWTKQNPQLVVGFSTKNGGVSQHEFQTLNLGFHVNDSLENVKTNRCLLADRLSFLLMLSLERSKHMKLISRRFSAPTVKRSKGI